MKIPTMTEASILQHECVKTNYHVWRWNDYCETVAVNAWFIADKCPELDADTAFILGLLHDIGQCEDSSHIKHIWDGYQLLMSRGWDDAAAICLTHSFPWADIRCYFGSVDIPDEAYQFISSFVSERTMTDYDRLIQLCCAISLPSETVLIDRRQMDEALRRGPMPELCIKKWGAILALKDYFDALTGVDIYEQVVTVIVDAFGDRVD